MPNMTKNTMKKLTALILSLSLMLGALPLQLNAADEYVPTESIVHDYGFDYPEAPAPEAPDYIIEDEIVDEEIVEDETVDEEIVEDEIIDEEIVEDEIIDEEIVEDETVDEEKVDDEIIDEEDVDDEIVNDEDINGNIYDEEFEDEVEYEVNEAEEARFNFIHGQILDEYTGMPIAGAIVELWDSYGALMYAVTGEFGFYILDVSGFYIENIYTYMLMADAYGFGFAWVMLAEIIADTCADGFLTWNAQLAPTVEELVVPLNIINGNVGVDGLGTPGAPWTLDTITGILRVGGGVLYDFGGPGCISGFGTIYNRGLHGWDWETNNGAGVWHDFGEYITEIHFDEAVTIYRTQSGSGDWLIWPFSGLPNLTLISGLENIDVSTVEHTEWIFGELGYIELRGIENWDVSNFGSTSHMFVSTHFSNLIDLSLWETQNWSSIERLFQQTINVPFGIENWDTSSVMQAGHMFSGAVILDEYGQPRALDLTGWDVSNNYWKNNMFSGTVVQSVDLRGWNTSRIANMNHMFSGMVDLVTRLGDFPLDELIARDFIDIVAIPEFGYMQIARAKTLTSIYGINDLDVSNVEHMNGMFAFSVLESIDLSDWNVGNVADFSLMFLRSNITTVGDISDWDTSNAETMQMMFAGSAFTHLDLSNWTPSEDMMMMFANMEELEYLNLSNWDTSDLIGTGAMWAMLNGANALATLVLGEDTYLEGVDLREGYWRQTAGASVGTILSSEDLLYYEGVPTTNPGTWVWQATNEPGEQPIQTGTIGYRPGAAPWRLYADGRLVIEGGEIQTGGTGNNRGISNPTDIFYGSTYAHPWHDVPYNYLINEIIITGELFVNPETNSSLYILDTSDTTTLMLLFGSWGTTCDGFGTADITITGLNYINTEGVVRMSDMFPFFGAATLDGIEGWDTSSARYMGSLFLMMPNLTSLDLSDWVVDNVTDMHGMFAFTDRLTTVGDISGWNIGNVVNMEAMFAFAHSITHLDLSGWNLASAEKMNMMFMDMVSLEYLNLSGWDTSNLLGTEMMYGMMQGANALATLVLGEDTYLEGVSLRSGYWRQIDGPSVGTVLSSHDLLYAEGGIPRTNPGTWAWQATNEGSVPVATGTVGYEGAPWRLYEDGTLIVSEGTLRDSSSNAEINNWGIFHGSVATGGSFFGPWYNFKDYITSIHFEGAVTRSGSGVHGGELNRMFADLTNVHTISGLENFNLGNVERMAGMFENIGSVELQGIEAWNVSNVARMNGMFAGVYFATNLDLSNWNTGNVGNFSAMFHSAFNVPHGVQYWDVSYAWDMGAMFAGAVFLDWNSEYLALLPHLDLSGWQLSDLLGQWLGEGFGSGGLAAMFMGTAVQSLDLTGWDAGLATDISFDAIFGDVNTLAMIPTDHFHFDDMVALGFTFMETPIMPGAVLMFTNALTNIYGIAAWDTSEVLSMSGAFAGTSLNSLDLSNWDTGLVTNMSMMFTYAGQLTTVGDIYAWDVSGVYDMHLMFYASALTELDLSGWDVRNVNNMLMMFAAMSDLEYLNLSGWDTSGTVDTSGMLQGANALATLVLGEDTYLEGVSLRGGYWRQIAGTSVGTVLSSEDLLYNEGVPITNPGTWAWQATNEPPEQPIQTGTIGNRPGAAPWRLYADGTLYILSGEIQTGGFGFNRGVGRCPSGGTLLAAVNPWHNLPTTYTFNRIVITGPLTVNSATNDGMTLVAMFADLPSSVMRISGLEHIDLYGVINIMEMFGGFRGTHLDGIGAWDVSTVQIMASMFADTAVTSLDISGWDVSSVTNMESMFVVANVTGLDLSGWDVSNVTSMINMFLGTNALTTLNVSTWDLSSVTNMQSMFNNTNALAVLDISGWDTRTVSNMSAMFIGMNALRTIVLGPYTVLQPNAGLPAVSNTVPFLGNWIKAGGPGATPALGATRTSAGTAGIGLMSASPNPGTWVWNDGSPIPLITGTVGPGGAPWRLYDDGTLRIAEGEFRWNNNAPVGGVNNRGISLNVSPWYEFRADITSIVIEGDITVTARVGGVGTGAVTLQYLFANLHNVTNITGLERIINISNVEVMASVFNSAIGLTSLDLSGWDTSSATHMNGMFWGASGLTSLNISGWDTSSVTRMNGMFGNTSGLTSLDLSGWDTSNVTDMFMMFESPPGLKLSTLILGPEFHFIGGTPAGTEAGLPAVPTTGEFNGHWTDGTRFVTSAELMQLQAPATAGTWVWATGDLPVATGTVGIGGAPWRIYADGTLIVSTGELRTGGGPSNAGTGGNSYNRGINTTAGNIGGRDIVSPWHDFREYFTEIQFIGEITVQSVLMGLFAYLTDVTVISGLENIETEGVYDMGSMFYRSGHFYEVQGLEDWDVSYVTGMIYMFAYAIFTNAPDLSKWDTASLTSTEQMFVFTYNVPHGIMNWNTENVTRMADMFLGAAFIEQDSLSPLALLDLTGWDVGNVVSMFNVFRGTVVTAIDVTGWQLDSVYTTSYMFMSIINDTDLSFFNEDSHPYLDNLIYIGGGVRYWYEWDDSQEIWISTALTAIYGLEGWDMENVSFMQGMFVATRLTELELTSWRTTSAEDIGLYAMFAWATELTTVGDLSGWDISGVNNLVIMFADTVNLTYVGDISAWDVSDVYEMMMMFAGSGITHLDLSGWDVTNVDSMFAMFQGMEDLVYLNLSGWDTEHLLGDGMMTDMLHGADALATIVLGEDTYLEGVSLRDGYWRQTAGENIGKELSSFALLYAEVGVPTVNPGTWNWIEIELYTLTVFNPGAEGGTESGEIASGTVVTLDHGTRTDGYVFAGWTSDAVSLVVNTFTMPAADVIVEAVWIHEDDILAQGSIGNRINAAPWTITNCGILHIFGGEIQMNVAVDSVIDVNRRGVGRNNTGTDHDPFTTAVSPWFSFAPENINTISIHDDLFVEEARNEYMSLGGMFSNFTNTDTAINGLEHINTMGVRTLSRIFANFGGPLVSGIEFWDVSEVTMMNSVFFNANALTALDLSEWDVSNVTSLDSMFANATSLVVVNLTGWDTTSEPLRGFMFSQTVSLRQLMLGPDTLLAWSGAGGNLPEAAQHSGGSFVRLPQYTGYWVQTDPDAATPVGETRNSGTVVGAGLLSGASNPGTWEWQTNPEFLLTIINPDAEDGTESGYVVAGTVVTLDHGTRTGGYVFAGWTSDDVPVFIDTFAMPAEDATVTAVWIHEDDIAIYGTVGPHGAPWFLLNNGTLRLFSGWLNQGGSDAERNHGMSQNRSPWHPHHELITNIIIEGNVEVGNASYYLANMFNFLSRVTTINGLDRIRTDNVRNMRSMFAFNAALTTLDVSGFDVSNVTDMSNMFSGAHALRALDVSDWDVTSNVTNMNQMFSNTWVLATLDVSGWDVSNVTNMNNMFMNMYALTTLDVSNWNVSSVTNMRQMFINVNTLTVLDVSNWNISNVTNMENMFSEMFALQSLDFSGWDTHNNLNMSNMLANTRSLSSLSLGENITLAANAGLLTAAQHLPVAANPQYTGWWVDADNAEDMRIASEIMGYTFDEDVTWIWQIGHQLTVNGLAAEGAGNIAGTVTHAARSSHVGHHMTVTLNAGVRAGFVFTGWTVVSGGDQTLLVDDEAATTTFIMPANAVEISANWLPDDFVLTIINPGANGTQTQYVTYGEEFTLAAGTRNHRTFVEWTSDNVIIDGNVFTMPAENVTVTAVWELDYDVVAHGTIGPVIASAAPWYLVYDEVSGTRTLFIYEGEIQAGGTGFNRGVGTTISFNNNVSPWADLPAAHPISSISSIIIDGALTVNSATNINMTLAGMFRGLTNPNITITGLDQIDTTGVSSLHAMFLNYRGAVLAGLEDWDTSSVTNMSSMFSGATVLTTLGVSEWNVGSVTNMSSVFENTSAITTLDLSKWVVGNVTDMNRMFHAALALEYLDISEWNVGRVTNMNMMFANTRALETLDVSEWNVERVTNMANMFQGASALTVLDVSNWDVSSVTTMENMFNGATALTTLDVSEWEVSNLRNVRWMFQNASSLTALDLSGWYTRDMALANMAAMFSGATALRSLSLGPDIVLPRNASLPVAAAVIPLPNHYTRLWVNAADPSQTRTSTQLMDEETHIATWVWQVGHLLTVNGLGTNGYSLPSSGTFVGYLTEVGLNAGTRANYTFAGWTVTSGGDQTLLVDDEAAATTFIMPANAVTITANWDVETFTVTLQGGGTGVYGYGEYAENAEVILYAGAPAYGYHFVGWYVHEGGVELINRFPPATGLYSPYVYFIMPNTDVRVEALWAINRHQITVTNGGEGWYATYNTVNPATSNIPFGADVMVYAGAPASYGFVFNGWNVIEGDITLTDRYATTINFVMPNEAVVLEATWTEDRHTVTILGDYGDGAFVMYGAEVNPADVPFGVEVTIYAGEAPAGFVFDEWILLEGNISLTDEFNAQTTFTMPNTPVVLEPTWRLILHRLTVLGVGEGWMWAADPGATGYYVEPGAMVTIYAGSRLNQTFNGWTIVPEVEFLNGTSYSDEIITFTMPAEGVSATANWLGDEFLLTIIDPGTGGTQTQNVRFGTVFTLTAGTRLHHEFTTWWSGDVVITNFLDPYAATFTMPARDIEIEAEWALADGVWAIGSIGPGVDAAPWVLFDGGHLVISEGEIQTGGTGNNRGVATTPFGGNFFVNPWHNLPWNFPINSIVIEGNLIVNPDTNDGMTLAGMFANLLNNGITITGLEYINTSDVRSMEAMFANFSGTSLTGMDGWDVSSVENMTQTFQGTRVTSLDLSTWDTSSVISMFHMFSGSWFLTSLNVASWDTRNVENMSNMFAGVEVLQTLDVANWNTSSVIRMDSLFMGTEALRTLDVSSWDVENVRYMNFMFHNASSLTALNLANWNPQSVVRMDGMFGDTFSLTTIGNVANWNTGSVTTMAGMFNHAESLVSINASNWDVSNVTNMTSMFAGALMLTSIGNVSNWNTGNVTLMNNMFNTAESLQYLNAANWDTSSVTNMMSMFMSALSLRNLDVSGWDISNVTNIAFWAMAAESIAALDLSNWNTRHLTAHDMRFMLDSTHALSSLSLGDDTVLDVSVRLPNAAATTMESYYTGLWVNTADPRETRTSQELMDGEVHEATWVWQVGHDLWLGNLGVGGGSTPLQGTPIAYGTQVTINAGTRANHIFNGWIVVSGDGVILADESSATTTFTMPNNDVSIIADWLQAFTLTIVNPGTGGTTTQSVSQGTVFTLTAGTRAHHVFTAWSSADVEITDEGDPDNATFTMPARNIQITAGWRLADGVLAVGTIGPGEDAAPWVLFEGGHLVISEGEIQTGGTGNNRGVGTMPFGDLVNPWEDMIMTSLAYHINTITIEGELTVNPDTNNGMTLAGMFTNTGAMQITGLEKIETTGVRNMSYMFYVFGGITLTGMDVWDVSDVENMASMFAVTGLTSLDLSDWDTGSVINMSRMFENALALTSINVASWDTSSVTNMSFMFNNVSSLAALDLSGWETSGTNMSGMFTGTHTLRSLTLGSGISLAENAALAEAAAHIGILNRHRYTGMWVRYDDDEVMRASIGTDGIGLMSGTPNPGRWVWQVGHELIVNGLAPNGSVNHAARGNYVGHYMVVSLNAGTRTNMTFNGWTIVSGEGVVFVDADEAVTTFVMPANAVEITANWIANEFTLTVVNPGTGGTVTQQVRYGTEFTLAAGTYAHHVFVAWSSDQVTITDEQDQNNATFTMPANDITVTASWRFDDDIVAIGTIGPGEGAAPWVLFTSGTLVISEGEIQTGGEGFNRGVGTTANFNANRSPWHDLPATHPVSFINAIVIEGELTVNPDTNNGMTVAGMFRDLTNPRIIITGLDNLNMYGVASSYRMFSHFGGTAIAGIDEWDMSAIINMSFMFVDAQALTALYIADWDTSAVETMESLFARTQALAALDVSGWDTSSVALMTSMFSGAESLAALDLSDWDTLNVLNMQGMFAATASLTTLNLSGWDTRNVGSMGAMFVQADALRNLTLGTGITLNSFANLPNAANADTIPNRYRYTGMWVIVDNAGEMRTSAQLMDGNFHPGTWVWQTGHQLTVNGLAVAGGLNIAGSVTHEARGSHVGQYMEVILDAGYRASHVFNGWTVVSGDGVIFADASERITTFPMPDNAVTITANWLGAEFALTVVNSGIDGTQTQNVRYGTQFTLNAGIRPGYAFDGWLVISGNIAVTNAESETTTLMMPNRSVTVEATWVRSVNVMIIQVPTAEWGGNAPRPPIFAGTLSDVNEVIGINIGSREDIEGDGGLWQYNFAGWFADRPTRGTFGDQIAETTDFTLLSMENLSTVLALQARFSPQGRQTAPPMPDSLSGMMGMSGMGRAIGFSAAAFGFESAFSVTPGVDFPPIMANTLGWNESANSAITLQAGVRNQVAETDRNTADAATVAYHKLSIMQESDWVRFDDGGDGVTTGFAYAWRGGEAHYNIPLIVDTSGLEEGTHYAMILALGYSNGETSPYVLRMLKLEVTIEANTQENTDNEDIVGDNEVTVGGSEIADDGDEAVGNDDDDSVNGDDAENNKEAEESVETSVVASVPLEGISGPVLSGGRFINGFTDGTIRPDNTVTRAETAMMIFRLIEGEGKYGSVAGQFTDVAPDAWYAQAVNYLASVGILIGFPDGTFRPDAEVTMAEITAITARFFGLVDESSHPFTDVGGHWAEIYVNAAYIGGWSLGYESQSFRPDEAATRAETIVKLSRAMGTIPVPESIHATLNGYALYSDLSVSHWAFYYIMEASILLPPENGLTLAEDEYESFVSAE